MPPKKIPRTESTAGSISSVGTDLAVEEREVVTPSPTPFPNLAPLQIPKHEHRQETELTPIEKEIAHLTRQKEKRILAADRYCTDFICII